MGSLAAGAGDAASDVGASVCFYGGPPEIPLQQGKGAVGSREAGKMRYVD